MARPGGRMNSFCEPVIATSTFHSSNRNGIGPMEETPFRKRSALCPTESLAPRSAPMADTTPVAVSLCVASMALILPPTSARSTVSTWTAPATWPRSRSITVTSRPWGRHTSIQRCEDIPMRVASTPAPGENVLLGATSEPAVCRSRGRRTPRPPLCPRPPPRPSTRGTVSPQRRASGDLVWACRTPDADPRKR